MESVPNQGPSVWRVLRRRWYDTRARKSWFASVTDIWGDFWEFLLESTPERKRRRYGDIEYDWDFHVDTTAATVSHRTRLLAALSGAPYQPTEPSLFREMIAALAVDLRRFTFVDLGSGKGRTLLMASEFPFRCIVGVELAPELNQVALANIANFGSPNRQCRQIESVCLDARDYEFPPEPLVLYLFNPLPAAALEAVLRRLRESLKIAPREVRVIYHNPLSENVLASSGFLQRIGGTHQYSIYSN